jgi:hypothetical protein
MRAFAKRHDVWNLASATVDHKMDALSYRMSALCQHVSLLLFQDPKRLELLSSIVPWFVEDSCS